MLQEYIPERDAHIFMVTSQHFLPSLSIFIPAYIHYYRGDAYEKNSFCQSVYRKHGIRKNENARPSAHGARDPRQQDS